MDVPFHEQLVISCGDDNIFAEARDISLGGMFVNELTDVSLPAVVRWIQGGIGLLGVRETHIITEIVASHERNAQRAG